MSKKRNRLPVIASLKAVEAEWDAQAARRRVALEQREMRAAWIISAARLQFTMEKIMRRPEPPTIFWPTSGYGLVLGQTYPEHLPGPGVPPPPGGRGTGGKTIGGGLRGDYLLTDDG